VAIKLKIPTGKQTGKTGWLTRDPLLRAALVVFLILATAGGTFLTYYYVKFGRVIDQRFKGPVFGNSARIYAIAHPVQVGEKIEAKEIATQLRRAGYSEQDSKSPMGSFRLFEGGRARTLITARSPRLFVSAAGKLKASPAKLGTWRPTNSNRR
jgi:penicillin-binding protein 1B